MVLWALVLLGTIVRCAVDVPVQDEWELFQPSALPQGPWGAWIIRFHNEHRMVFSNLLGAIDYRFFGLDFASLTIISFCIYLSLLYVVWTIVSFKVTSAQPWACFTPFLFFPLLSALPIENFLRFDQSSFHVSMIGFFMGTAILASRRVPAWRQVFGVFGLFFVSIYSFSSGLVTAWVSFAVCAAFAVMPDFSREALKKYMLLGALLFIATFFWAWGYKSEVRVVPYTFPWSMDFWAYYAQIVALGFGFGFVGKASGALCLLTVLGLYFYAAYRLIWKREYAPDRSLLTCWVLLGSLLTAVALVTFGRAISGVEQAKASRYEELVGFLPILSGAILYRLNNIRLSRFKIQPAFLLLALALGLTFKTRHYLELGPFFRQRDEEAAQRVCVRQIIALTRPYSASACPDMYGSGAPPAQLITGAVQANARFARVQ